MKTSSNFQLAVAAKAFSQLFLEDEGDEDQLSSIFTDLDKASGVLVDFLSQESREDREFILLDKMDLLQEPAPKRTHVKIYDNDIQIVQDYITRSGKQALTQTERQAAEHLASSQKSNLSSSFYKKMAGNLGISENKLNFSINYHETMSSLPPDKKALALQKAIPTKKMDATVISFNLFKKAGGMIYALSLFLQVVERNLNVSLPHQLILTKQGF